MKRPDDRILVTAGFSTLVGILFVATGWYGEILHDRYELEFASIARIHQTSVIIWIMDSAPLIMGLYGYFWGRAESHLRQRLQEQIRSEQETRAVLNNLSSGVVVIDDGGRIQSCNSTLCEMFGYEEGKLLGQKVDILIPKEAARHREDFVRPYLSQGEPHVIGQRREIEAQRRNGEIFPIDLMVGEMTSGGRRRFIGSAVDLSQWKRLEAQLYQAQKLESIGQLAAGVAHEINTPIQYVGDNLHVLEQTFQDIFALIQAYRRHLPAELPPESLAAIRDAERRYDLEYILEDTPKAIRQSIEGTERVSHIVRAMKDFSHIDRAKISAMDINLALLNTLTIARNEYKYVADIHTDFASLPLVECYASDLNQVFLNLIVNAAHAIAEKGPERGLISLSTHLAEPSVEIRIGDNGAGIPKAIRERVYDPFFTTKEVGKGTGQGFNIAHQVVKKHGGSLWFESEEGRGTTFFLKLPLQLKRESQGERQAV